MTPLWTFQELLAATGGTASGHFDATGVAFDSREIGTGDLFLALKGAETDGHLFVDKAFANGAAGAIVSQPVPYPHILVADTMQARGLRRKSLGLRVPPVRQARRRRCLPRLIAAHAGGRTVRSKAITTMLVCR